MNNIKKLIYFLIIIINYNNTFTKINIIKSNTAKNGYNEEIFLVNILNTDIKLLTQFEKFINKKIINNAVLIKGNKKSDINISNIFIQHKKTKMYQFGQIDRHYIDDLIMKIPKIYTCKNILQNLCNKINKINNLNYSEIEINNIINTIEENKRDILNYAFNGYEEKYKPNIFSISIFNKNNKRIKLIFWKINDIFDYLINFFVSIRKSQTVIQISNGLTFQRKGGDNGKKQANNFQFKFVPTILPLDNALVYEL